MTDALLRKEASAPQPLSDGTCIYATQDGVCALNATAVQVLELCDGTRTRAQVARDFADRYPEEDADTVMGQVAEALRCLVEHGLVREAE